MGENSLVERLRSIKAKARPAFYEPMDSQRVILKSNDYVWVHRDLICQRSNPLQGQSIKLSNSVDVEPPRTRWVVNKLGERS